MSRHQSERTTRALALIGQPRNPPGGGLHTAYSAALAEGIALATIYRALARQRKQRQKPQ